MNFKSFSHQEKALILAGIFCILLIGGIIFLGFKFSEINQDGVKCLSSPLVYAETRMLEDKGVLYDCSCSVFEPNNDKYYPPFS